MFMDMQRIMQQVDRFFMEKKGSEAEALLRESIVQAMQEQDDSSLLQLVNELLGYYRETSQVEASYQMAEQAIRLVQEMGLEGTLPYATTMLNVANAYRAGGRLGDSLAHFQLAYQVYDRLLEPNDVLVASLENNMSLLYQEFGDYERARDCLLRALKVVESRGEKFETAVTYANLAATCLETGEEGAAGDYAGKAKELFEELGVTDAHYGAALAALGSWHYRRKEYRTACDLFSRAMEAVGGSLGHNDYYHRLQENLRQCEAAFEEGTWEADDKRESGHEARTEHKTGQAAAGEGGRGESVPLEPKGLELCRRYYEQCVVPMLEERFPEWVPHIAVGLVGKGSDCFGYDDALSRDHDWGPEVCLWVSEETYAAIGEELERAYGELPKEWEGYQRKGNPWGEKRRGVQTVNAFYQSLIGTAQYDQIAYDQVGDAALAAAVNGEVFTDPEGSFTHIREQLQKGYPQRIRFLKLAEAGAHFSQNGQYNWKRLAERGEVLMASILLGDAMRDAMRLFHYIKGVYPPHDKWLRRSLEELEGSGELVGLLQQLWRQSALWSSLVSDGQPAEARQTEPGQVASEQVESRQTEAQVATAAGRIEELLEALGSCLAELLYREHFISDQDAYLDHHTPELLAKASLVEKGKEQLVEEIVKLEFQAFDQVENEGGRASCQDDWNTFSIMRRSQYQTWNINMLVQYLYDFYREYRKGHNLITEKYGRMMESTAPEEYAKLEAYFPTLSDEKRAIVDQITALQVGWMEDFAARYPHLAGQARSIHSYEDHLYNTSYETYLRGELSTYSDKMLELYGRYIVEHARRGENLTEEIMTNSTLSYGYKSLEAAEQFLS